MNLDKKTVNCEFKQLFNAAGERNIKIEIYPFSCKGLDYVQEVSFNVQESSATRVKFIENLESRDKKLKIEASFFQEMISSIAPPQEDDEESEDEAEEENKENDNSVEGNEEKEKKIRKKKNSEGKSTDQNEAKKTPEEVMKE